MLLFRLYIAYAQKWGEHVNERKAALLASAARLFSLGVDLEAARDDLRCLTEQGVSYNSEEMLQAYRRFSELESQWKSLEQQHLKLRDELLQDEPSDA